MAASVLITVMSAQAAKATTATSTTPGAIAGLRATISSDQASVRWLAPTAGPVARYEVQAYLSGGYYGTRVVASNSLVWDRLPFNQPVDFVVRAVGRDLPDGSSGPLGPAVQSSVVMATDPSCGVGFLGDCVAVDTTEGESVESHPGSGLLHGTVGRGNTYASELHLSHWRIQAANATQYRDATAYVPGSNVIEVLSDAWQRVTEYRVGPRVYAADPWADWNRYVAFVRTTVATAEAAHQDPYWEIQNEPENYPYSPAHPPSRSGVELEYMYAYRAIKSVDPNARVIGPSIDWVYESRARPWYIDMKTFIAFAAAHDMKLAAVVWHDNNYQSDTASLTYDATPQALRDQAENVRELIAEKPILGHPRLFVDENSSGPGQFSPGWAAGYLAEEDRARIDLADRACWPYPSDLRSTDFCFGPHLDQLLNEDGAPNASLWTMVDYARMSGTRVWSESNDSALSSLAVTASTGVSRILLGRHQTCSGWTAGPLYCPVAVAPLPVPVAVHVHVGSSVTRATVTVQELPDTLSDMRVAPLPRASVVPVQAGMATVTLPAFGDGEAYFLTVVPAVAQNLKVGTVRV